MPLTIQRADLAAKEIDEALASLQGEDAVERVALPLDDETRECADSVLPVEMIIAGSEALEQCQNDLREYVSGETPDWDNGMIAVAVYRAMTKTARAALEQEGK